MFVIIHTDTNRSMVFERKEFFRCSIENSFKEFFSENVAKDASDELIQNIGYSDVHCIIVHNGDIYAVNEKNNSFELIDKDEFERKIGCFFKKPIADKFCKRVLEEANEKLKCFAFSNEKGVGFSTKVLEKNPVISFDGYGNFFLARELSTEDYAKWLMESLKSGFSEKYAKIVADEFVKKFIDFCMLSIETPGESFFIKWKNGELNVVSYDDGKTCDEIKKFIKPFCKDYKKIINSATDLLMKLYFNK